MEPEPAAEPVDATPSPTATSRRTFLRWLGGLTLVSTAAMVLTPVVGFLIPSKNGASAGGGKVLVGTTADIPAGAGKVVAMGSKPAIVVNTEQGVKAYSAICTHLGCVVAWNDMVGCNPVPLPRRTLQPGTGAVDLRPAARPAAADHRLGRGRPDLPDGGLRWRRDPEAPAGRQASRLARPADEASGRSCGPACTSGSRCPARTYYFGGIALFLFGIQVATGTLLALYYKPTPEAAYESVQFITSDVSFGWLIRQRPPLGRQPDDPVRGPAPAAGLLPGGLQVPARAHLGLRAACS